MHCVRIQKMTSFFLALIFSLSMTVVVPGSSVEVLLLDELTDFAPNIVTEEPYFRPTPAYRWQDDSVPANERLDDLLSMMTLDEKISHSSSQTAALNRLNLSAGRMGFTEALHGLAWSGQATVFPNSLGLSQSWNKNLLWKIGEVVANELLASNINSVMGTAPVVDLTRDPRYGRAYETFGEDAYLVGSLGVAMAEGMNKRDAYGYQQAIPALKHFLAYGAQINRLWIPSATTPRTMSEYYSKSFYYPIASGASKHLMNSYPVVNGKPMTINPIQREALFGWTPNYPDTGHYEYVTMNDYGSGSSVFVHSQRYLPDNVPGRALGMAQGILNGQMAWSHRAYGSDLGYKYEAIARGMAAEEDFEDVARRNMTMRLRLGNLDQLGIRNEYLINPAARYGPNRAFQIAQNKGLALQASQEQIVLLKNDDHYLPLSGTDTTKAILLGAQSDQILKDFYSGNYTYNITIKDALENKLGKNNVFFDRAIDSVAIQSKSTGKYLVGGASTTYSASGSAAAGSAVVTVDGNARAVSVDATENRGTIFEVYDYGSANWLLRTPINGRYVQVIGAGTSPQIHASRIMYNNTTSPGEGNISQPTSGQILQYSNFQKFRIIDTDDGYKGIWHHLSGNGINGGVPMAYDVDDEDLNRGSYLMVDAARERVVPDIVRTNGPWQSEYGVKSPVDTIPDDGIIDGLLDEHKFVFEEIQTVEQAAQKTIVAANDVTAPVILVVGYEPHLNAREAIDLYETGLSKQQMRLIDYVTKPVANGGLNRDAIVVVKTGNPMTIDRSVHDNPKVKAILLIGQTGQEEGSALASTLFDNGYTVPETGFSPADSGPFILRTGGSTFEPFAEYPGYLPPGSRIIPAYAPAGRLSATWYDGIEQMIGASGAHPPSSFMYPAFDEEHNNNLSNMNGTIPTGLLTYDIIKGERTYQYLNATPLYPFGFGLTYTDFEYSDVTVSAITTGPTSTGPFLTGSIFTVSGKVTNRGLRASDEVVQIYSSLPTQSRIRQPNLKLIAYDRLNHIEPGTTRNFHFTIDMIDKLGVWDVEVDRFIVEPGSYTIKAVPSSSTAATAGNSTHLVVTTGNGGTPAAVRNLSQVTLAQNFDDYSNVGGKVADIEPVSSSIEFEANTAVLFRQPGAWLEYKNVRFDSAPTHLTVKAGSDRTGSLEISVVPAGSTNTALAATISLVNTRKGVSAVNLGIGQIGVAATPTAAGSAIFPGSAAGRAFDHHYVKPEYFIETAAVSGIAAGTYDILVRSAERGSVLEWLKFGTSLDTTQNVEIYSIYSADSIRAANGTLQLGAKLTPVSSAQPVVWSVTEGGTLATIDPQSGLLTATGAGNGHVTVMAASGGSQDTYRVMVTNQLPENKVMISGAAKTIDYLLIRNSTAFGIGDVITAYGGTAQMGLASSELLSENPAGYVSMGTFLTVPTAAATWSVTDLEGEPTTLAEVSQTGLVTASGEGNGKVLVTAILDNNPDIAATRIVTLLNQGNREPYKMNHFADHDFSANMTARTAAYAAGANEMGFYIANTSGTTVTTGRSGFRGVDFDSGVSKLYMRLASATGGKIDVWVDGFNQEDGTLLASMEIPSTGNNNTYKTFSATIDEAITGEHDVYFIFSNEGAIRANWFQFDPDDIPFDIMVEVLEWNPAVTSLVIELKKTVTQAAAAAMNIEVNAKTSAPIAGAGLTAGAIVYNGPRTVIEKYVSETPGGAPSDNGKYINVNLKHGFNNTLTQADGCAAAYYPTRNFLLDLDYTVKLDGDVLTQRNIIYEWEASFDLVPNPVEGFTSQNYRISAPDKYMGTGTDNGAPYPLVLWNHGGGETYLWDAVVGAGNEGSQLFANMGGTGWLKNAPEAAYILAPQRGDGVNAPGYSHQGVTAFITDLIEKGLVDGDRIYVAGPSAGGAETHTYLRTYADMIAAAIPICAGAQNAEQVELFKHVPVWYVHADNDNPQNSLTSYNNLKAAGSAVARRTNFAAVTDGIRPTAWGTTPRHQLGSVFGPHLIPSEDYIDAEGHPFRYYADGHWSWIMVLNNIKPGDAPVTPQYTTAGSENDTFMGWLFNQVRPVRYAVRYDANGGTFPTNDGVDAYWSERVLFTQSGLLPVHVPVRDGYKLVGWKSEHGIICTDDMTYGEIVSGNIAVTSFTMLAQWEAVTPVTSIRIDSLSIATVARYGEYIFRVILNDGANNENIKWTIADPSLGYVDDDGKVTIFDKTGNVRLTATDIDSGLSHSITLRIAS